MGETHAPNEDFSRVALIIPALNEARGLAALLPQLDSFHLGQIIVADNGSTDGTGEVAARNGASVALESRRGYGAACQTGVRALNDPIDVVAFMDADLSDDPANLPAILSPIARGQADLVIGCRDAGLREPGSLTPQQVFGNRLATALIRMGWNRRYRDLGPFRAITRKALDQIAMRDQAYGWTVEMQVRAVECGLRVVEIPVPYRRRIGKSKISGTVRGVILAGYWILRTIGALWLTKRQRLRSDAEAPIQCPEENR